MSSLAGHERITREAFARCASAGDAVCRRLDPDRVVRVVCARDILDLLTLGHWRDAAQCRHFMRRFDGQSGREAHAECCEWIRTNAAEAARRLSRALSGGRTGAAHGGDDLVRLGPPQALGNALHAAQDSFAPGHAEREAADDGRPGAIRRILRYAGAEKRGHAAGDRAWRAGSPSGLSASGQLAVDASANLLALIADAAGAGGTMRPEAFDAFRATWLRASDALDDTHDEPIPFLRRF